MAYHIRVMETALGPTRPDSRNHVGQNGNKNRRKGDAVEEMFIEARWPNGIACPKCGSLDIQERPTRKPQPFRCRSCRKDFFVKTGTVMQGSNLRLGQWALAAYQMSTSLKGVSSMKLARDLGVSQPSAWHLAHRIRKAWEDNGGLFSGPVEVDEPLRD